MPEGKNIIGLSWEPKLPSLLSGTKNVSNHKSQNVSETSLLYKPNSELIDGLFVPPNDPKRFEFDMPAPTLTPELKKDLQLLKLRNVIDPKRHYKKGDSKLNTFPKYFQVGTVVEPVAEYFTSRLTKRERKATLADELLSDQSLKVYRKRKVREIEEKNQPGGVDKSKTKADDKKGDTRKASERGADKFGKHNGVDFVFGVNINNGVLNSNSSNIGHECRPDSVALNVDGSESSGTVGRSDSNIQKQESKEKVDKLAPDSVNSNVDSGITFGNTNP
ncbi:hypothetical protein L2E82_27844 [Cichorium intybus]|uniref:Uncharacterized protein n=1 Tax=Cichorium intybus TaxID=13427 RepID=A0ACB9CUC3_CICIN|nr:hypothetical protein L2E82_27844 [Cichorium intybus]